MENLQNCQVCHEMSEIIFNHPFNLMNKKKKKRRQVLDALNEKKTNCVRLITSLPNYVLNSLTPLD